MKRPPVAVGILQLLVRHLPCRGHNLVGALVVCGFGACMASTSYAETPNGSAPASAPVTRDPGSYLGQMRLGLAQYSLGKFSDAEGSYGKVLALHPADLEARSGLAWALLRQHKNGIAEGHFRAILELSPQHPAANEGMALLHKH